MSVSSCIRVQKLSLFLIKFPLLLLSLSQLLKQKTYAIIRTINFYIYKDRQWDKPLLKKFSLNTLGVKY